MDKTSKCPERMIRMPDEVRIVAGKTVGEGDVRPISIVMIVEDGNGGRSRLDVVGELHVSKVISRDLDPRLDVIVAEEASVDSAIAAMTGDPSGWDVLKRLPADDPTYGTKKDIVYDPSEAFIRWIGYLVPVNFDGRYGPPRSKEDVDEIIAMKDVSAALIEKRMARPHTFTRPSLQTED